MIIIQKKSGILWQYCRNEPALPVNSYIADFNAANGTTNLFKIKAKIAGQTSDDDTIDVEIMVPLKY